MKNIIVTLALIVIIAPSFAQVVNYTNSYLSYRMSTPPQTTCFMKKGDLVVVGLKNAHLPVLSNQSYYNLQEKLEVFGNETFRNFALVSDNRINATYSISNFFAVGLGYQKSLRYSSFLISQTDEMPMTYGLANTVDIMATYRNSLKHNLSYELGTNLILGKGGYGFKEPKHYYFNDMTYFYWEKSSLTYSFFSQNLLASVAYKHKRKIVTAQINAGYVRYYNAKGMVMPHINSGIIQNFTNHQTDFYIDPAIILNINLSRFGLQLHTSYPYTFGESKISKPMPTVGCGVSYRISQKH